VESFFRNCGVWAGGEIRYKKKLPQIPKKADSNEKKSEEKEDATELPKQNEEDKKLPSVDKSDLDAEAQEIANDMRMIEYDMVAGKGYLSKDFFKVPQ